jgi:hypothetical protein
MLSVIMLNVILLGVFTLSVVSLSAYAQILDNPENHLPETNTLAYFSGEEKSFKTLAPKQRWNRLRVHPQALPPCRSVVHSINILHS